MQDWTYGLKEKTLLKLLIKKGIITKEEWEEEYEKVKREAWDNRHGKPE